MKQYELISKVLAPMLLLLNSCTILVSTESQTATSTIETNNSPETAVTQSSEVPRITMLHEWVLPAQNIKDIKWSPAGEHLVILTEEHVTLYDTSTFEEMWRIESIAPAYYASAATFSSDGKTLTLYTRLTGLQRRDTRSGMLLAEKPEYNNPANCFPSEAVDAVFSSDINNMFVSINREDSQQQSDIHSEIHAWNVQNLECTSVFGRIEGNARSVDLSFDGKYLALGVGLNTSTSGNDIKEDGQIAVRNLESGQLVCSIAHQGSFARFKPGNSVLLVANPAKNQLVYWNVETCDMVGELTGITTRYDFAFSPDGRMLALLDNDNDISIIDPSSGTVLQTINDPTSDNVLPMNRLFGFLSFSPDGKYLIYAVRKEPFESMIFIWAIER